MTQAEPNSGVRDVLSPKAAVRQRQHMAGKSLQLRPHGNPSRAVRGGDQAQQTWPWLPTRPFATVTAFAIALSGVSPKIAIGEPEPIVTSQA